MGGCTVGFTEFAGFLKEYYNPDRIAAIYYHAPVLPVTVPTSLEVGIAATAVLAGLGWLIARRNALAQDDEEVSRSWIQAVGEWLRMIVGRLFSEVSDEGAEKVPPRLAR